MWLITEYAEGGSLYSLLHSEVEIAWEKRWLLAFEAAKAINYLHHRSNPIIHRYLYIFICVITIANSLLEILKVLIS